MSGSADAQAAQARVYIKRRVRISMLEAIRYLARQRCRPSNCGTVCLCPPCHARRALEYYETNGRWP